MGGWVGGAEWGPSGGMGRAAEGSELRKRAGSLSGAKALCNEVQAQQHTPHAPLIVRGTLHPHPQAPAGVQQGRSGRTREQKMS